MMRLANPWFLALIVPILALLLWRGRKVGTPYRYSITELVAGRRVRWLPRLIRIAMCIVLAGMVLALARPVMEGGLMPVVTRSRDTIILIDRSGSMNFPYASGYEEALRLATQTGRRPESPTKYDLARELAAKFIEARPDDRIAACVFFDYAFFSYFEYRIVCPLPLTKYDHDIITGWLRLPDKAEGGTPIAEALRAALLHLEEMGQTGERTLILLSDGDGAWSPEMEFAISELLAKTGTKLFWVYIESTDTRNYKIEQDGWSASQSGLHRLISQSGGRRFDAGSREELEEALETIRQLATEPAVVRLPAPERELYPFVISGALALLVLTFAWIRLRIR